MFIFIYSVKVQIILELLFVHDGHFTFNNFISITMSDVISLADSIYLYWLSCERAYRLFALCIWFHTKYAHTKIANCILS